MGQGEVIVNSGDYVTMNASEILKIYNELNDRQ
jgi:hypothetical protein